MINGRPLLYLSLPGLAIVIGLVWFRRKKSIGFDSGGNSTEDNRTKNKNEAQSSIKVNTSVDIIHTKSVPICSSTNLNGNSSKNHSSPLSSSSCSGKSAPIDIIPNTRSPPKYSDQQLDAELLKLKIEESDIRNLRLIEEQDDTSSFESTPNFPGALNQPFQFDKNIQSQIKPIVVKASMTAKISPENSFATELNLPSETEMQISCNQNADILNNNINTHQFTENDTCISADDICDNITNQRPLAEKSHSPIASPSLSSCSVHSRDSGNGSSLPQSECALITSYEFLIPTFLISRMLGRKASFVQLIKAKTGANVLIKRNFATNKTKICSLKGTQIEIDSALALIRIRFPEKRFSILTLERVDAGEIQNVSSLPLLDTICNHLQLIEGINNDVTISFIANGGHMFLQMPLHPTFVSLNALQQSMCENYNMIEAPSLPDININAVCVVSIEGIWYRVQIMSHEDQECSVKYLDYGGYANVNISSLRQIRTDFMRVPFQSIECVLSNVKPSGDSGWSLCASDVLNSFSKRIILQAQVAGYTTEGLPEIYLFASLAKNNVIFINQELVARGLAVWVD